ncbi:MAG: shikimate kinase [Eubacteriales bacterium]|nr:shikimate kinase [Eubacteriales bacterium]
MSGAGSYGLIGRKLGHSYSSLIHGLFGVEDYRHIELEPEELAAFLQEERYNGLNVTIPYKLAVMEYCSELSDAAREIGAVNTLHRGSDGKLYGHNTDAYGLQYALERAGIELSDRKVLVFGSGGASRTCCYLAKRAGAREVRVISRNGQDNYENLSVHADAEILINATPVGMYPHPEGLPADPAEFPHCEGVMDLIYNPCRTRFLLRAEELGLRRSDGLPMLVAQAAAADEIFTGEAIPKERIEAVLREIRSRMMNIVLVGMPGSGKSHIGRLLKKMTGRELFDTDAEIVRKEGRSIPEIFEAEGEEYFRALEREAVREAGNGSGRIIVTGGGVVKDERNLEPLRRNGRIYHLERELSKLSRKGRPLSLAGDLGEMYAERKPMYERFRDVRVKNSGAPQAAARAIREDMDENSGD